MVMPSDERWVGTWAAAPAPAEGIVGFNNQTIRLNPRVSIGGERLRVFIQPGPIYPVGRLRQPTGQDKSGGQGSQTGQAYRSFEYAFAACRRHHLRRRRFARRQRGCQGIASRQSRCQGAS